MLVATSACSLATSFAGYIGDQSVAADAALVDAGSLVDGSLVDGSDAAAQGDAGGDGSATVCRPGFTGATCSDACPKERAGIACELSLVYGLDVPTSAAWTTAAAVPYSSNHASAFNALSRVGYHLVLDQDEIWIEMDAFTQDATQLGVPVTYTFDAPVSNVIVYSFSANQKSVLAKTGGHVQLWSNCYDPDADGGTYDGLDVIQPAMPSCYGTMQINVGGAPVLGFHRWAVSGNDIDIGIGPGPDTKHLDWTFVANAGQFKTRRLEVYAR